MTKSFLFFSFFYSFEAPGEPESGPGASSFSIPVEKKDDLILCRNCLEKVTNSRSMAAKEGAWEHTFTNAYGYVFRVGCFTTAPGCIKVAEPTEEFTWFKGYQWQFCLCRNCMQHLGWYYSSGRDSFFGLILTELLFQE